MHRFDGSPDRFGLRLIRGVAEELPLRAQSGAGLPPRHAQEMAIKALRKTSVKRSLKSQEIRAIKGVTGCFTSLPQARLVCASIVGIKLIQIHPSYIQSTVSTCSTCYVLLLF